MFVYEPKGNFLHQGQWSSSTTILGAMLYQEIAAGVVDVLDVDYESFKDNCHTFEESTSIENKQNMHKSQVSYVSTTEIAVNVCGP